MYIGDALRAQIGVRPERTSDASWLPNLQPTTNVVAVHILPSGRDLSDADIEAMVSAFDANPDDAYSVTESATLAELRAAASARREAEGRIEAAALAAHRAGPSWGVIGTQLGMTRQGARQRFERLVDH